MALSRAGGHTRHVKVHDHPATQLSAYPRPIRQLTVTGLGHDQPTLLITNRPQLPARQVIQAYARRMNIEQRLAEAIQSFSLDALTGAVPLNIDLDVVLAVLAHTVCAALRRRLPGYGSATPDTLQRRFLSTSGIIENHRGQTTIRLSRRTYLTGPAPGQHARNDQRALVGRPDPPLPVRLTLTLGGDSLSENRR